jgi:hypothetical protein
MERNYIMTIETTAIENLFPAPLGQRAVAYWVPIEMRECVLAAYRNAGISVRIRFRGSRIDSVGREMPCIGSDRTYRRTRTQANQDCLLVDATHFSVYVRN